MAAPIKNANCIAKIAANIDSSGLLTLTAFTLASGDALVFAVLGARVAVALPAGFSVGAFLFAGCVFA